MHQAALWDNAELLEDLLTSSSEELACLNARDSWGRTALHAAATNDDSRCLRILVQARRNYIIVTFLLLYYTLLYFFLLMFKLSRENYDIYERKYKL